jgi:acyl carrier protein
MAINKQQEEKFWLIFKRVLGSTIEPGNYAVDDIAKWDSLNHIELIFELEENFAIDISPEDISNLYTDTSTILHYLHTSQES